jgi:hypothetical protein
MIDPVSSSAAAPSSLDVYVPRPVELSRAELALRLSGADHCLGCGTRSASRAELRHEGTRGPKLLVAVTTLAGFVVAVPAALLPFWSYLGAYDRFAEFDTPAPERVEFIVGTLALALVLVIVGPVCARLLRAFSQRIPAALCSVCEGHMHRTRVLLEIASADVRLGIVLLGGALGLWLPFFEAAQFEGAMRPITRHPGVVRLIVSDGLHLLTTYSLVGAILVIVGLAMTFHVRRRPWANVLRHELVDPLGAKHRVWIATRVR